MFRCSVSLSLPSKGKLIECANGRQDNVLHSTQNVILTEMCAVLITLPNIIAGIQNERLQRRCPPPQSHVPQILICC